MEAKRPKITSTPSNSGSSSTRSVTPPQFQVTLQQLKSSNLEERLEATHELKKQIISKETVDAFLSSNLFVAILERFGLISKEMTKPDAEFPPDLKSIVGILGNCCHYSTKACLEMKQAHIGLNHIIVKIAESATAPSDCKYSLIRLLANMCAHKETALFVATQQELVAQIIKFLESDHSPIVNQAMRCIGKLINASFIRALLQSNAAFILGKLLATKTGKIVDDCLDFIISMSKKYAREVGRQVASSDCAAQLLNLFLEGNQNAQQLVVKLCGVSSDIRDKFGEKGTIGLIAENKEYYTEYCCSLLSTFAQDAWGRANLRTSGALDVIINRFSEKESSNPEKMSLILALKHFIHDTAGIAHLACSRTFIDTVVKDVQVFVDENGSACKPSIRTEDESFRADSPLLIEIENRLKRKQLRNSDEPLHKDFFSLWGYNYPSPSSAFSGSDNLSPPSSGAGSPVCRAGSPDNSVGSYVTSSLDQEDSSSGISKNDRVLRTIVDSELWLISWATQEDCNLPMLVRADLVNVILNYLSLAPRPEFRVARALKRIAGYRLGLDKLLDMEFHTRVLDKLCNTPCRLHRNARRCVRCEKSASFGREVLKEFAQHVDSDFGHSFVAKRLASDDFDIKTNAAIAKVILIKHRGRLDRRGTISNNHAFEVLMKSLETLLQRENIDETVNKPIFPDGPPLCVQIISAFSSLVSQNKIRELFEIDATFVPSEIVECKVSNEDPENDAAEHFLKFVEDNGNVIAYVGIKEACENCGFFEGMFSADLMEKTSKQRTFIFDPIKENCSADDFTKFLHWLGGCRDECTSVKNTKTCLAMIELSDRYLCPSLSSWICSPHGPTSRLISGESLHYLFPAALTTHMHSRFLSSCFAILMRYANADNIVQTLLDIHKTPLLLEIFLKKLRDFVKEV